MLRGRASQQDASAPSQSAVDAHFDEQMGWWRDVYDASTVDGAVYRRRRDRILAWIDELHLPPGASILEVGGGAGSLATELVRRGHRVLVVDSSEEMIAQVRRQAEAPEAREGLTAAVGDVHRLELPDGAFSVVIAVGVLPWLHDPVQALREMARVAEPSGAVVVTSDNASRLTYRLDPWAAPALRTARRHVRRALSRLGLMAPARQELVRMYRRPALEAMLGAAGLRVARLESLGFGPFTVARRPVFSEVFGRRLEARLQRGADHGAAWLRSAGNHHVVLARRRTS